MVVQVGHLTSVVFLGVVSRNVSFLIGLKKNGVEKNAVQDIPIRHDCCFQCCSEVSNPTRVSFNNEFIVTQYDTVSYLIEFRFQGSATLSY